jgi:hypothetical protein
MIKPFEILLQQPASVGKKDGEFSGRKKKVVSTEMLTLVYRNFSSPDKGKASGHHPSLFSSCQCSGRKGS